MKSEKLKVLIIGSNGMLGQRTAEYYQSKKDIELYCSSYEDGSFIENLDYIKIDLTSSESIYSVLEKVAPDIIINTAAYTAVDKAETEREMCDLINISGVKILASYAKINKVHFVNISTDYIFDGINGPYKEDDPVNPIGYYGLSKLNGEKAIVESGCDYTIIRTNVLYGPAKFGRMDFVKWVVSSLRENKEIRIVKDQISNPTYIDDLVKIISIVVDKRKFGVFNSGGEEFLSRFDFTVRIAEFFNLDKNLIKPILTQELNQAAKRPLSSGLILDKALEELGVKPLSIEETFRLMKEELNL